MLIQSDIRFDFSPALFECHGLTHLNTMAINIFDLKFIENSGWLNKIVRFDIRITSYHFIKKGLVKGIDSKKKKKKTENYGLVKCEWSE